MTEAIAVVGILSSVLQVTEFAVKIGSQARKLIKAGRKDLPEDVDIRELAEGYRHIGDFSVDPSAHLQTSQDEISRLGLKCKDESQELLKKLQDLQIDPKSKGVKRFRDGAVKATKRVAKRDQIEASLKRLQELNGQLATSILQSLFSKLESYAEPGFRALEAIEGIVGSDVDKVLVFAGEHQSLRQRTSELVRSLTFPEQRHRHDAIEKAYPDTYKWSLEIESVGLKPWLESGEGIFWVTGKAGSGKSTLMKFLCNDKCTSELLRHWGNGKEVIKASFFFWYAGTGLQKSIVGLLRSILHQILVHDAELAQIAFPRHLSDTFFDSSGDWEIDELAEGVRLLATHKFRRRYCFIIDGLDEYDGDHLSLIALLRNLSRNCDIKLCLSSRPWNAFRNAFQYTVPNLRIEEFSRPDIQRFVDKNIETGVKECNSLPSPELTKETSKLVHEIVDKAEGVFLWVFLVVKSVLRGLGEGDSVAMLRHRVEVFPADLDAFFSNILGRVDNVYKQQTCQSLKLAFIYTQEGDGALRLSTFLDYWLIGQSHAGLEDKRFPYKHRLKGVSHSEWTKMVNDTRNMLMATCKDLLCLPSLPKVPEREWKVSFLHRTVFDFLRTPEMQHRLNESTPEHFKDSQIFHLLNLAGLKFRDNSMTESELKRELSRATDVSIETNHEHRTEEYVAEFESVASELLDDFWYNRPRLVAASIAFRHFRNVFTCLDRQRVSGGGLDPKIWDLRAQVDLVEAAMGDDSRNEHGPEKINVELIKILAGVPSLLDKAVVRRSTGWPYTAWERYLQKWFIYTEEARQSITEDELLSNDRNIWEIAKVFLSRGNSPDIWFCPDLEPTRYHFNGGLDRCARGFLKAQVPREWLLESQYTAHLVEGSDSAA